MTTAKAIESENTTENGANSKTNDEEMKDQPQAACSSSSSTSISAATSSNSYSSRNDLIRDIESHIEIIFECFELDDSVSTIATAAAVKNSESSSVGSSNEVVTSSEISQEKEKSVNSSEKTEDLVDAEKKGENQSD